MSRPDFSAKKKVKSAKARKNAYQRRSRESSGNSRSSFTKFFWSLFRVASVCVLVFALSIALLAGYRWLTSSSYFDLKQIEIKGNQHLSAQRIIKRAKVSRGQNCLALNMGKVKNNLLQDAWIKKVMVRRVLPDELVIKVSEHQPAYWLQKENRLYYADSQGKIIAPVLPQGFISLPLLRIEKDRSRQMQSLALIQEWTEQKRLPFSMAEVAWLRFLTDDILEFYLRDRNMALRLGTEQLERNFRYLSQVWSQLLRREELERVDRILVYEEKAWVRMPQA